MKSTGVLWLATALAAAGCEKAPTQPETQRAGPSLAATAFTQHETIPFDLVISSSCANEDIHLVGSVNVVFQAVNTASGGLVVNGSANFVGVTGVGLTSGLSYRLVGKSVLGFDGPSLVNAAGNVVQMAEITQLIVSGGNAPNQSVKFQIRFVQTPDGTVRIDFVNLTLTCH